jgi:hypothetical protein
MTRYELDGRAAIVTGAGAGIGEACARALAFSGAPVLVVDLDDERAERVAAAISVGRGGHGPGPRRGRERPGGRRRRWSRARRANSARCASPSTTPASPERPSPRVSTTLTVPTGCGFPVRMLPSARLHSACSLLCTLTPSDKEGARAISPRNEQTRRGRGMGASRSNVCPGPASNTPLMRSSGSCLERGASPSQC